MWWSAASDSKRTLTKRADPVPPDRPKRILVAATGGVAAIKTPTLLRRLHEAGYHVRVAATQDAYRFASKLSLAVAAGSEPLDYDLWFRPDGEARHLSWAHWADAVVVAPASADALAAAALGRADDIVAALLLAAPAPVLFAPAMNEAMWRHPAVQRNVQRLREDGHRFVGPVEGAMAARHEDPGVGRMAEPEEIVEAVTGLFAPADFSGRHVLVSAGPTREYLDPVRFLSNPSSGKMGFAVAAAARDRGARVTVVAGPTTAMPPAGVDVVHVMSAQEMLAALDANFDACELLVMAAAVADWRPRERADQKQPKSGSAQTLELVRTPDILQSLAPRKGDRVLVGFAMETDQGVERAREKATKKNLDFICLNYPTRPDTGFGGDMNELTIVTPGGSTEVLGPATKRTLADDILDRAHPLLPSEGEPRSD